jgi:hypothetical protein
MIPDCHFYSDMKVTDWPIIQYSIFNICISLLCILTNGNTFWWWFIHSWYLLTVDSDDGSVLIDDNEISVMTIHWWYSILLNEVTIGVVFLFLIDDTFLMWCKLFYKYYYWWQWNWYWNGIQSLTHYCIIIVYCDEVLTLLKWYSCTYCIIIVILASILLLLMICVCLLLFIFYYIHWNYWYWR